MKTSGFFFVAVLVFFGCSDEEMTVVYDGSYFPLHVGDFWQYRPANEMYPEMNPLIPVITREITGTAILGGLTYFKMEVRYDYPSPQQPDATEVKYFRLGDNGFVYEFDTTINQEWNPYRPGAIDGDSWKYPAAISDFSEEGDVKVSVLDIGLNDQVIMECKNHYYDVPRWADEEYYHVLGRGLGIVAQGNAWGFNLKLEKAVIDGTEYNF